MYIIDYLLIRFLITDSPSASNSPQSCKQEPSITEIMKTPSKVVLLRVCIIEYDLFFYKCQKIH